MKQTPIRFPSFRSTQFARSLRHFRNDERGLSTVEYVILLAVIVVGAVGIWNSIGGKFKDTLGKAESEIESISP